MELSDPDAKILISQANLECPRWLTDKFISDLAHRTLFGRGDDEVLSLETTEDDIDSVELELRVGGVSLVETMSIDAEDLGDRLEYGCRVECFLISV